MENGVSSGQSALVCQQQSPRFHPNSRARQTNPQANDKSFWVEPNDVDRPIDVRPSRCTIPIVERANVMFGSGRPALEFYKQSPGFHHNSRARGPDVLYPGPADVQSR